MNYSQAANDNPILEEQGSSHNDVGVWVLAGNLAQLQIAAGWFRSVPRLPSLAQLNPSTAS